MLLDGTRQRIQMTGAPMTAHSFPCRQRGARCLYCGVDVLRTSLRDPRDDFRVGRVYDVEMITSLRPLAVDELPELPIVPSDPGESVLVALRRRAVFHRFEDFSDGCHYGSGWRYAAE